MEHVGLKAEHVPQRTVQSCSSKSIPRSRSSFSNTIVAVQPAGELLDSARDGLREGNFHHVEPETLCALALAASGGMESLETWCEDIAEARLGVCQMTLSVAETLAANQACFAFGWPTKQTLLSAVPAMYFAAALLEDLSSYGGIKRSVHFCVKGFFAGPKASSVDDDDDDWPQPPLLEQVLEKGPSARLELLWHNFTIALRHVVRLQTLEAQSDVGVSPMHIAQRDETLASIARACQVTVQELRKINPDMPTSIQCGDCIALPRPCQPRLYCTRRGDSWASIANFLHTPPGKLRLHNADALVIRHGNSIFASLTNSSVLLDGQLIEAPGLGNGSSDWGECSDESRMEEYAAELLMPQQSLYGVGQYGGGMLRSSPILVGTFEPPVELQNMHSREITGATLE